jgi:hypothetical protein
VPELDALAEDDMWTYTATWHGTRAEFMRLVAAMQNHCECETALFGRVVNLCPAHAMLRDQRVLDHLVFTYRSKGRFQELEWGVDLAS